MEKLELKHLAGYLPYGLKCQTDIGNLYLTCLTNHDNYNAWFHYGFNNKSKLVEYNLKNNTTTDNTIGKGYKLSEIKPILHPLSDLIKYCEDLKFIPIENMFLPCGERKILKEWAEENKCWLGTQISFLIYQQLFEWYFDIHGLIEKGLAIDINTL